MGLINILAPGGASGTLQYNNAGAFGGVGSYSGGIVTLPTRVAFGDAAATPPSGYPFYNDPDNWLHQTRTDLSGNIEAVGWASLYAITADANVSGGAANSQVIALRLQGDKDYGNANGEYYRGFYALSIASTTGDVLTGPTGGIVGFQAGAYNAASPNVSNLYGALFFNESDTGNVAKSYGVSSSVGIYGGVLASNYDYHAATPDVSGGGAITTAYQFYGQALTNTATNAYSFWADEQGVFRVRADNTFNAVYQAIPALYNPQFTKYTPGAANYERVVLSQWNSNVAEIGNEAGGTGVLRSLRLLGASVLLASDDAYGAGWNGSLALPTKNAIYDKIEAVITGSVTSITGTANQVVASAATGAITLSLPQSIAAASAPEFAGMTVTAAITPKTNDAAALGSTSLMWSDLFLASGAVVNFNNGNVTLTHSAGILAVALNTASNAASFSLTNTASGGKAINFYLDSNSKEKQLIQSTGGTELTVSANTVATLTLGAGTGDATFKTNGSQRLYMTGAGLLGVGAGTGTPSYALHVAPTSGVTAAQTVFIQDATATTGSTKGIVKAGAGQSTTALWAYLDASANNLLAITSAGGLRWGTSLDVGVDRNAAGVLEINSGTAGTLRDLKARGIAAAGDNSGIASTTGLTNVTDTTLTNAYVVKGSQAASTANTGWIKIYIGTTAAWVPYWANATP